MSKAAINAMLPFLGKLGEEGFEITLLDVNENGLVSARQMADAIREDTCLVSVMYANNEIGMIRMVSNMIALFFPIVRAADIVVIKPLDLPTELWYNKINDINIPDFTIRHTVVSRHSKGRKNYEQNIIDHFNNF